MNRSKRSKSAERYTKCYRKHRRYASKTAVYSLGVCSDKVGIIKMLFKPMAVDLSPGNPSSSLCTTDPTASSKLRWGGGDLSAGEGEAPAEPRARGRIDLGSGPEAALGDPCGYSNAPAGVFAARSAIMSRVACSTAISQSFAAKRSRYSGRLAANRIPRELFTKAPVPSA